MRFQLRHIEKKNFGVKKDVLKNIQWQRDDAGDRWTMISEPPPTNRCHALIEPHPHRGNKHDRCLRCDSLQNSLKKRLRQECPTFASLVVKRRITEDQIAINVIGTREKVLTQCGFKCDDSSTLPMFGQCPLTRTRVENRPHLVMRGNQIVQESTNTVRCLDRVGLRIGCIRTRTPKAVLCGSGFSIFPHGSRATG